jgi:putative membrane protein
MELKLKAFPAIFTVAAITCCAPAFAQSADQARTAHQDTKFLEKANQGSVDEIELAQIVLKKSNNDDVKAFAQKMIDDHTTLISNMQPFDNEAGLKPPAHPDASTEALKLKLDVLSGETFDKAYIKAMVEDHHKDLQDFMAEEKATAYPAFRDAVKQGEQVVRTHLKMIDDLAKKNGIAPAPVPAAGL